MANYRVFTFDENGDRRLEEFKTVTALTEAYEQIGLEQDSYSIRLHGEPMLRGLIGPMSDGKTGIKYEQPKVFVAETEEWAKPKRGKAEVPAAVASE